MPNQLLNTKRLNVKKLPSIY